MIKHFNNKTQKVGDDLKTTLEKGSKISIAAAIFSIYGFESLKKELKNIEELRFITNTEKKYTATKDFKKRVLDSAKKELDSSDFTDLTFTYEDIKKGRSISGFRIHIFHTKNDKLIKNKLTKQVSPNWDFEKPVIDYLNRNKINFNGANRELLKSFFKLKGTNLGLDFLEKTKDTALRKSRTNPQGYIIGAVKKHLEQKTEKSSVQTDIITQIAESKKV